MATKATQSKAVSGPKGDLRVAIVHDWLTNIGGAERVVMSLLKAFPSADLYTSVYNPDKVPGLKTKRPVRTSFLQHWPLAQRKHQLYPAFRTLAFESFDLSNYDLVISSSSAEAKGIITPVETKHLSYIYTPVRYYWSNYSEYLRDPGFGLLNPLIKLIMPPVTKLLMRWDYAAAQRPDALVGISKVVQARIKKYYGRDSDVIYPPVDLSRFDVDKSTKGDYYLAVSRLVPYKRYDIAVEACTRLGKKLVVVGAGPELKRLKKMAGPTIEFKGFMNDSEITELYHGCKAFIFPGEEDFGITPLEAMACGKPVLAYAKGGVVETVVNGKTGVFFDRQSAASLMDAIGEFEAKKFDAVSISKHAQAFGEARFIREIQQKAYQLLG